MFILFLFFIVIFIFTLLLILIVFLIIFILIDYFNVLNVGFLYLIILILFLIIVLLLDYNMHNQNQIYLQYVVAKLNQIRECNLLILRFDINILKLIIEVIKVVNQYTFGYYVMKNNRMDKNVEVLISMVCLFFH